MTMITSAHWRHTSIALPRSLQERKLRIWKADDKRFHTDETFLETHHTDHLRRKNGDAGDCGVLVHLWQEMWRFWQLVLQIFNIGYLLHILVGTVPIHLCSRIFHVQLRRWWMSNWAILIWNIEIASDFLLIQSVFLTLNMIFLFRIFLNFSSRLFSCQRQIHL